MIHIILLLLSLLFIIIIHHYLLLPLQGRDAPTPRKDMGEEKKRDRGTEGGPPIPQPGQLTRSLGTKNRMKNRRRRKKGTGGENSNPISGDWCAHRGWRIERKTKENKNKDTGRVPLTKLPRTNWSSPKTRMDHTGGLFWNPERRRKGSWCGARGREERRM